MIAQGIVFRYGSIRRAIAAIGMVAAHVRGIMAVPMVGMHAGWRLARIDCRYGTCADDTRQRDGGCQHGHQDCLPVVHRCRIRPQDTKVKPLRDTIGL